MAAYMRRRSSELKPPALLAECAAFCFSKGKATACTIASTTPPRGTSDLQSWRTDLGDDNLPVVFAQLGREAQGANAWGAVRDAQARVALPGVSMIHTDDLDYGPDGLHFSTGAYLEIGRRFAEAMAGK